MRIEAGKFYRTRSGQKVGPMVWHSNSGSCPWQGCVGGRLDRRWQEDGRLSYGDVHDGFDLVAEWTDEHPAVSPKLAQDGQTTVACTETAAHAETPSTDAGNEKYGGFAPEHVGQRYTITIPVAKLTGENGATGTASIKIIQTSADGGSTVEVGDPLPPVDDDEDDAYEALADILAEAHDQAAYGKGRVRHANGRPWLEQPIMTIGRDVGLGYPTGQALKKIQEAVGMVSRGERDAAVNELLGAIVYAAAAVQLIREGE